MDPRAAFKAGSFGGPVQGEGESYVRFSLLPTMHDRTASLNPAFASGSQRYRKEAEILRDHAEWENKLKLDLEAAEAAFESVDRQRATKITISEQKAMDELWMDVQHKVVRADAKYRSFQSEHDRIKRAIDASHRATRDETDAYILELEAGQQLLKDRLQWTEDEKHRKEAELNRSYCDMSIAFNQYMESVNSSKDRATELEARNKDLEIQLLAMQDQATHWYKQLIKLQQAVKRMEAAQQAHIQRQMEVRLPQPTIARPQGFALGPVSTTAPPRSGKAATSKPLPTKSRFVEELSPANPAAASGQRSGSQRPCSSTNIVEIAKILAAVRPRASTLSTIASESSGGVTLESSELALKKSVGCVWHGGACFEMPEEDQKASGKRCMMASPK